MDENIFNSPLLERKVICISNNFVLSAQISSCFNESNTYFVVLEPPRSMKKYWANDFIKLNNVIVRLDPEYIVFTDVPENMVDNIKKQLRVREDKYVYINKKSQIKNLPNYSEINFNGVLQCPPDRTKVAHALLHAKREKLRLVIDTDSEYVPPQKVSNGHIIVVDDVNKINSVISANYAFACNAQLEIFTYDSDHSPREMRDILEDTVLKDSRGLNAKNMVTDLSQVLHTKLPDLRNYDFVTFFTTDVHYGHFFSSIPSTHIYNNLLPSYLLATSVATAEINIFSALLVDTGFFKNSETDDINDMLTLKNVFIKELRENQFTNLELDNFIQFYPYDLLFICSHAGFPLGRRLKVGFQDSNKCEHIIVIDVMDTLDPTDKGQGNDRIISVKAFYEFVELDGQPWYEKKYKKGSSKTVVEDFTALGRKNWHILEIEENVEMRHCNVIKTQDPFGPYMPAIHSISDPNSTPFVFNNACVSNYTLGDNFIGAGAIFYIGTIKSVLDSDAVKVASLYFEKTVNQGKSLAISLWEAQTQSDLINTELLFTSIGCHFLKFRFSADLDNLATTKLRIKKDARMRNRRSEMENLPDDAKRNHLDAIDFLYKEYQKM